MQSLNLTDSMINPGDLYLHHLTATLKWKQLSQTIVPKGIYHAGHKDQYNNTYVLCLSFEMTNLCDSL
jgi:hypothetical protein